VSRALSRFLGLWAILAGVELLERVSYRAGVVHGGSLEPADLTDVLDAHGITAEDLADAEDDAEWTAGAHR
jgi:2-hydroxychromene-2-carboxylate isomerase